MTKRCCCGCLSITMGAQLIALLLILSPLKATITAAITRTIPQFPGETAPATIAVDTLEITTGILVFIACNCLQPLLMQPIVLFCGIRTCYCVLSVICAVYGFYDNHSVVPNWLRAMLNASHHTYNPIQLEKDVMYYMYGELAYFIVDLCLGIWYFSIWFDCYKHLEDIERSLSDSREALAESV